MDSTSHEKDELQRPGEAAAEPPRPLDEPTQTDVIGFTGAGTLPSPLRLLVISGPDAGRELCLERGTYLVGKEPGCALVLTDPAVSRHHLEVAVLEGGLRVRDLDSKNGSLYQGARFSEITVGAGAVIRCGRSELRVVPEGFRDALPPSTRDHFGQLLGPSLTMRELFGVLERVADSDVGVLIEGETGTGKELCAEAIHAASRRAQGPFAVCDLASISRTLIEAELFGHVRGAFTGADRDRDGAFVTAAGGTIFIDEVGELDLEMQPRLLRALERRQIKPVGASGYRSVDVRVVAATNRDLAAEVRAGRFRDDLYHRIAVVRVRLPSLRERKEDIPHLVSHFLASAGGAPPAMVPPETMALLVSHDWPGNVRELKNVLDRGLSLLPRPEGAAPEPPVLTPELLGLATAATGAIAPPVPTRFHEAKENLVHAWERDYLTTLLTRASGNISRAAREAGMDRVYLHRLLKKHGIDAAAARHAED
jgi:DNA-binding NtrC family response regulator